MKTLLKNARILKMPKDEIIFGDLLVEGNKIAKIGENLSVNADKVIDCDGNLLMPGFKNVHTHTAMVFARSASDDLVLHDWLFDCIFPMEAKFQPGDIYHLTKLGILEYLRGGVTTAFDMYFTPPEIIKASEDMGFRTCILATSDKESIAQLEYNLKTYNQPDSLISYKLGIHAEYTTSLERMKDIADLANRYKIPVYLHISEGEQEVKDCVGRYGTTPLKFLDSLGMFNYGGGGFHCVYFTDEEIEIAKKRNFKIITCPCSNLKLASGIAPIAKYQEAGLEIGIGTDGAGSNNALDMFREMYLVSTLQKVINKNAAITDGFDVLKMATYNGANIIGLEEANCLEVGKLADIIMIDLKNPSMQPINNISKNIVYSGSKDCVKMTMINGEIRYMDGKYYINEDVAAIMAKAQEVTDRLKAK